MLADPHAGGDDGGRVPLIAPAGEDKDSADERLAQARVEFRSRDSLPEDVSRSSSDEEVEEACCLVWALSHFEHALVEKAELESLHAEIKSCADKLDARVLEETATSGAFLRPRVGQQGPSAEDSMVRLGQLLCRWAAQKDPPFGLRVGVHTGRVSSIVLSSGQEGFFGDGLSTARSLAEHAPKDAVVHLSKTTKDQLCVLERLSFSCTASKSSYYLEPWTQVVEGPNGEDDMSKTRQARQRSPKRSPPRTPTSASASEAEMRLQPAESAEGYEQKSPSYASRPTMVPSLSAGPVEPSMSLDEFRDFLTEHRVDVYQFGKNQAKTLPEFYKRVVLERKSRLLPSRDGGLEQHMALVRINLVTKGPADSRDFQLWLNSEILEDGRARGRVQKLAHTLLEGYTWDDAVEQCFVERFRLKPGLFREEALRIEPNSYSYHSERAASQSTPGIMTTYMTHEVTVRVVNSSHPEFAKIGLPGLTPFSTVPNIRDGVPESNWAWHAVGEEGSWQSALTHLLMKHGIKVEDFTTDALAELWEEVYRAKYATLSVREDFELERRINIVKVWLCANILSLEHVLVRKWEVEKDKKNFAVQDRPLTGRMLIDQAWEQCVWETVESKLGLDGPFQREHIVMDERSYRLSEEIGYSNKFPGLRTLYCIHEVRCRVHNPATEGVELLGLPDGHDFTITRNKGPAKSETSGRTKNLTSWCWKPLAEVMYSTQSFQYGLVDQPCFVNEKHNIKRRLPAPPPPRLPEEPPASGGSSSSSHSGCWALHELMRGKRPNLDRALNAAKKIRDANYTCRHFFDDCSKAFPELALYVTGSDLESTESLTSSGRTGDDEYQRTMGALFAVYWLMRRSIDGAQSFCFGVDNDWNPLSESSSLPSRSPEEVEKRKAFLEQTHWEDIEDLLFDAGLLKRDPDAVGGLTHDVERTLAMLVLTAIHDIMKVKALLPIGQDGEKISDHDAALAYVLEHYPDVLPSFAMLPRASRHAVKFTQCKMEYNMGWLVQAEAPPGALFKKFKQVITSGSASEPDVAFYFVHWLTDLAGAEPCPQEGCEKFVLKFPQRVLASFLSSFSIVKQLAFRSETDVLEDYLLWRWRQTEEATCGPPPSGSGSTALLRLVVMAQGDTKRVISGFQSLRPQDREILETELAISGCEGQLFGREFDRPVRDLGPVGLGASLAGGPAILVYYSPALMQKAGAADPCGALALLADIFRQARQLFPMEKSQANETVTVRIDALKELQVPAIRKPSKPGEVWLLQRTSWKDAQVQQVNLMRNQGQDVDWQTSRVLFVHDGGLAPDLSLLRSRSASSADAGSRDVSEAGNKFRAIVQRRLSDKFSPAPRQQMSRPTRRTCSMPEQQMLLADPGS